MNACSSHNHSIHNPWDIRIRVLNLFMHHLLNVRHKTLPFSFNLSLLVPTVYLLHHDIYTLTHILRRNRVLSGYSCFARLDGWPNPQYLVVLFSIPLPECIVPTTYIRTECEYVDDIALGCEKLLLIGLCCTAHTVSRVV